MPRSDPLRDLQVQFITAIQNSNLDPDLKKQLHQNHIPNITKSRESLEAQFSHYCDNHRTNHIKVLANHYPVSKLVLGEDFFNLLSYDYLKLHPSSHFSLNEYGAVFPEFLGTHTSTQQLPYLYDLLKLEWIIHQALFGPANPVFDFEALRSLPQEHYRNLIFLGSPNGYLFSSCFPVDKIWDVHYECIRQANNPNTIPIIDLKLYPEPVYLYVGRAAEELFIKHLSLLEWILLKEITTKKSLKAIYENEALNEILNETLNETLNRGEAENKTAFAVIADLIHAGCITGFELQCE